MEHFMIRLFLAIATIMAGSADASAEPALPPPGAKIAQKNDWWSLQPILKPTVPAGEGNPIDAFILEKLVEHGLEMSPEADARTLIRRVSFDLTGLPPAPEEVEAFVERTARSYQAHEPHRPHEPSAAYEALVDKLLSSPRYGERWARHWLDVVHFGETHGYDKDKPRPHAWPYRDYVIRAFNEDRPYARFVQEQLAGDILFPGTVDGVTALGFISAGPWDLIGHAEVGEDRIDGKIARHLDRDDMSANTLNTFCSMTVHCAQCHDHKFDPITAGDYYSLQSVFAALDRADLEYDEDPTIAAKRTALKAKKQTNTARIGELKKQLHEQAGEVLTALDKTISGMEKAASADQHYPGSTPAPSAGQQAATARLHQARRLIVEAMLGQERTAELDAAEKSVAAVEKELGSMPPPLLVYAGTVHTGSGTFTGTGANGGKPRMVTVLSRGDVRYPGIEAKPGAVSGIEGLPARFNLPPNAPEGERRAALARWITDPEHPLTWRTMVNRVWHYHFGRGIVDTPNDFGHMGGLPTHPALLDWLAATFRDDMGGSMKQLHRLIVTSATYRQQSGTLNEKANQFDSGNSLLWRQNRRKLEAEAVRDSVLAVAGKLDLKMGGPSFQDFLITHPDHSPHYEYTLSDPDDPAIHRRSIYRFLVRSQQQPWMASFDCADPSMLVEKRNQTISPLQALALLNNQLMVVMAKHFATRLTKAEGTFSEQLDYGIRLAFGRAGTEAEKKMLVEMAVQHGMASACRVLLNLNEFIFVD